MTDLPHELLDVHAIADERDRLRAENERLKKLVEQTAELQRDAEVLLQSALQWWDNYRPPTPTNTLPTWVVDARAPVPPQDSGNR